MSAGRRTSGEVGMGTHFDYEVPGPYRALVPTGGGQGMAADYYKHPIVIGCVPVKGAEAWRMPGWSDVACKALWAALSDRHDRTRRSLATIEVKRDPKDHAPSRRRPRYGRRPLKGPCQGAAD